MGLIIVGELNPYGHDPLFALYHLPRNASGNRLRRILGLTDAHYEVLDKVNLCTGVWTTAEARSAADAIVRADDERVIVMLGAKVRKAFTSGWTGVPEQFFQVRGRFVSLPHPSGLNHLWHKDPLATTMTRSVLHSLCSEVPFGETVVLAPINEPERVGYRIPLLGV